MILLRKLWIALLLIINYYGSAQVIVPGGYVSGNWVAQSSPYIVNGDIEILQDSTLNIEPGVEVMFNGLYQFVVRGKLLATGTVTDSIYITTTDTITWWHGLKFYDIWAPDDDTSRLKYCRIEKGLGPGGGTQCSGGGAIFVHNSGKIRIEHCLLIGNYADNGGGILFCNGWGLVIDCVIKNNEAHFDGGGICFEDGSALVSGCEILYNVASSGGGICLHGSVAVIENTIIRGNSSNNMGGGITTYYSTGPDCKNVLIEDNTCGVSGGIMASNSGISLENVTIRNNWGNHVGGVYFSESDPEFSTTDRCNIYLNHSLRVQDIVFSDNKRIMVRLDTFTVLSPDSFLVSPLMVQGYDILNSKVGEQIAGNLYVSPSGSDTNSGISPEEPLKTICYAVRKMIADPDEPYTIFLDDGVYSHSATGEYFPISLKSNIALSSINLQQAVIDAENQSGAIAFAERSNINFRKLKIINGNSTTGGGIYGYESDIYVDSCYFLNNSAKDAGAIYVWSENNCLISNSEFSGNQAYNYGGGCYLSANRVRVENCRFTGNSANEGGAIIIHGESCEVLNSLFLSNQAAYFGGAVEADWADILLANNTFHGNEAAEGSAIGFAASKGRLVNSIIWDGLFQPYESKIYLYSYYPDDFNLYIDHSNISDTVLVEHDEDCEIFWGSGNIYADPQFANPEQGNFQLACGSPCIDAGTPDTTLLNLPETDLSGNPRIVNEIIDIGCFEFFPGVAVKENSVQKDHFIFPNPNQGHFFIKFSSKISSLAVYDINGKEIFCSTAVYSGRCEIDLGDIAPGLYLLRVNTSDDPVVFKIMVNDSKRD
jgi:hypothetical protein